MIRKIGLILVAVVGFGVAGCSTNVATGKKVFDGLMPESQEPSIGASYHQEVIQQYGPPMADSRLVALIDRIAARLVPHAERPLSYQFFLLDSPEINAFAVPGGYIYITRGLIGVADNEAQVAGVLAHEMGHITARHSAQQYSSTVATSLGVNILGSLVGAAGVGELANTGGELFLKAHSREHEYEADGLGTRYLAKAGYPPTAMADFLSKLERYDALIQRQGGQKPPEFFSTHPNPSDRVNRALAHAAAYPQVDRPDYGRDRLLTAIDGLGWGPSPREGYIMGNRFVHPLLGFSFQVPAGFILKNGNTAVTASDRYGNAIHFDLGKEQDGLDPRAYIQTRWLPTITAARPDTIEAITVNGMQGATVVWSATTPQGPIDYRAVALRAGASYYRFVYMTKPSHTAALAEDLRQSTYSFQSLPPQQRQATYPRSIRILKAKAGDTWQSLAARMAEKKSFQMDWLLLLNNATMDAPLSAGQAIKIVVCTDGGVDCVN